MPAKSHNPLASLETIYRAHIARRYETVEFLGLPYLKDERPLTLEEIYVPISLTWEHGSNQRLYVPQALEERRRLVVLGDPGSGKSTLVKLLAYSFGRIEPAPLARRLGLHIPVPIILRDYNVRQWKSPEDMLRDFIAQLDQDVRDAVTVDWLLDELTQGRGILLLDGLDEVGGQEDRVHLREKIVFPLLVRMPESLAVLTSRIVGYDEVPFDRMMNLPDITISTELLLRSGFPILWRCFVAAFNDEEVDQFIDKWYAARERDDRERKQKIVSLRTALRQNNQIKQLGGNPALLTLMALIHRVTAHLPSGRVKLYDKITEAYLETIQRYRGLSVYDAPLEQMKRWLAQVGWEMQCRRTKSDKENLLAARIEVLEWLTQAIQIERPNAKEEAEQFLDYIARRSGLLIPRGPDQFAFTHLTFQEYFAAWYLRGRLRRFEDLAKECVNRVSYAQWHETLVLLFEMLAEFPGTGDDLVDWLMEHADDPEKRRGAAELFAELLLDDQSGLSRRKQKEAAAFALTETCARYDGTVIKRLQQLPLETFDVLVRPWLDRKLNEALPGDIGEDFFAVAPQFEPYRKDWPEKLGQWVAQRGQLKWHDRHIEQAARAGGSNIAVCAWAAIKLTRTQWLRRHHVIETNLSDLCEPGLILIQDQSHQHRLLAQLSATLTVSHSQVIRNLCVVLMDPHDGSTWIQAQAWASWNPDPKSLPSESTIDMFALAINNQIPNRLSVLARTMALMEVVNQRMFGSIKVSMIESSASRIAALLDVVLSGNTKLPYPEWLAKSAGLATKVARAEWLFSYPDCPPDEFQTHVRTLERLTDAPDDWTRLLGITSLILLGEGTPERCAERNKLLDRGMEQPEAFTFPENVQEVTGTKEFPKELPTLLRLIFLHEPRNPWLKPEWFDPAHPAARFLRSKPREFFAQAAELLDPKGETELAKWRKAN